MGLHFSKKEFLQRKLKVIKQMKEESIDALLIFKSWLFAKTDASEGNPFEKYLYGWHTRTSSFHFEFYVYIIKTKCI